MLNTNNKSWHHSAFETLQQAGLSILTMFWEGEVLEFYHDQIGSSPQVGEKMKHV